MSLIKCVITAALCLAPMLVSTSALAAAPSSSMKTFLISSAYGVGFGALAGATVLAFSEKPGENTNSIARGASLGLYAGMGVGLYLVNQFNSGSSNSSAMVLPNDGGLVAAYHFRF